jgi:protein-arginine kinase activator protein McsA
MICDVCHEREATVHTTHVTDDVLTKQDLCSECFELGMPSQANESFSVFQSGCHYCGGTPGSTCPDLSAAAGVDLKLRALCGSCAQEFYRFVGLKLPEFAKGGIAPAQMSQVVTIFAQLDRHMKQWVSERDSR